ncbi:MAG: hypothetical protein WC454_10010 [Phycisphaerae bacterium]|jgi:hypothetical protein
MRLLNGTELWARLRRLPWLPVGSAILITPYTKVNEIGIAAFAYLMNYLHLSGAFRIDEKDIHRIKAMMLGEFILPKNKPIRVFTLPDTQRLTKGLASNADKVISVFQPEIITSLFGLTSTFGRKLREEAGLICRGLLRDDLLHELSRWGMRAERELEIPVDRLPMLTFKVMLGLTRVGLVQIDPWSGTFLAYEKPTKQLFNGYENFKEIILDQVDRYLEISTSKEAAG